jgi:hypothetical protein
MAFTQADIDALDAAFKSGASSVRTADSKQVVYRSVDEFERLRARMVADVAASDGRSPVRAINFEMTKGV